MKKLLIRLGLDERGASAVEMALILPILAAVVVLSSEGFLLMRTVTSMRSAVDSGAKLVMAGEANAGDVRTAVFTAWTNKPASPTVTVTRTCECAGVVQAACGICPDNTASQIFYTIQAQGRFTGTNFAQDIQRTQVVRVR